MKSTKGESIDAYAGGGSSSSSVEASVMEVERRGWTSSTKVFFANWETRRSADFRRRLAVARWLGYGWDEPYKPRGLRTVLWAAGGEIPPADPASEWRRVELGFAVEAFKAFRDLSPWTTTHPLSIFHHQGCRVIPA